jgi:hypothetical protein
MRIKINCNLGSTIKECIIKAKEKAFEMATEVEFDFNGVVVVVNQDSNEHQLSRDYMNSHIMNWKEIGPDTVDEYSDRLKTELANRRAKRIELEVEQQRIYDEKQELKRKDFELKVKGVELDLTNKYSWKIGRLNNADGYGNACFVFASNWGRLMQVEMSKGKVLHEIAQKTSHEADIEGITGYMYTAAVKILCQCWKHGEELLKWHNSKYNYTGDDIVNPSILTKED